MHKPSMNVCPEGVVHIALGALATLTFAALGWAVPAIIFLTLTVFTLNFFRDPERIPPEDTSLAVSPADGKVIKVAEMPDPFTGEPRMAICVFMNVFNVHVNRMPVAGEILRLRYHPGRFFNASLDKASVHNERNAVALRDAQGGQWAMVQIAGLVARRIVCWAESGDKLERGERFGVIKFGSRVDLYLPSGYVPIVAVGDKVFAGQTAVAKKRA